MRTPAIKQNFSAPMDHYFHFDTKNAIQLCGCISCLCVHVALHVLFCGQQQAYAESTATVNTSCFISSYFILSHMCLALSGVVCAVKREYIDIRFSSGAAVDDVRL